MPMILDPLLHVVAALGPGTLFLAAGANKLGDPKYFRDVVAGYQLMPAWAVPTIATGVVTLELLAGVAAIQPFSLALRLLGVSVIALLLLGYAAAIGINLMRGRRHIDCGCSGPRGDRRGLNGWLVARNLALAGVAALVYLPVSGRDLAFLDYLGVGAVLVATWFIYRAASLLTSLSLR